MCVFLFLLNISRQLAEEVLKAPPTNGEEEAEDEERELSGFEGMEVLAKAIETSMCLSCDWISHSIRKILFSNSVKSYYLSD